MIKSMSGTEAGGASQVALPSLHLQRSACASRPALNSAERDLSGWHLSSERRRVRSLRKWSGPLGGLVALLGAFFLISSWTTLRNDLPLAADSTAASFAALGTAITLLRRSRRRSGRDLSSLLAAAVLALAVGNLLSHLTSRACLDTAISQSVLHLDGCMSPATASSLVLASLCLLLLRFGGRASRRWFSMLASIGVFIPLVDLMGLLFEAGARYQVYVYTAMAQSTALAFVLLFGAIFLLRPSWGWMRVVIGRLDGSAAVRRLLPAVFITPLVLCWLAVQAAERQLFAPNFGISLLAIVTMTMLAALLLLNGALQNKTAQHRERAIRSLTAATRRLEQGAAERERLIHHLQAKAEELHMFCYAISHDLNSPIATLQGLCDVVIDDVENGNLSSLRDDLTEMKRAGAELQLRSETMLSLAKAGQPICGEDPLDLGQLFRDAEKLLRKKIEDSNTIVIYDLDPTTVVGDRERLLQVAQNLLENAIKYRSHSNPELHVSVNRNGTEVICQVSDNGRGIPARYHLRVFDLFRRASNGAAGTGIGLALCKRIVEAHGGRIWVESEGEGHGSTFAFTVKLWPAAGWP